MHIDLEWFLKLIQKLELQLLVLSDYLYPPKINVYVLINKTLQRRNFEKKNFKNGWQSDVTSGEVIMVLVYIPCARNEVLFTFMPWKAAARSFSYLLPHLLSLSKTESHKALPSEVLFVCHLKCEGATVTQVLPTLKSRHHMSDLTDMATFHASIQSA